MFDNFKFQPIDLNAIKLDLRNPRIVTQQSLKTQDEVVEYLFAHDSLAAFMARIAHEGYNRGAEQPYVVREGPSYTVIEGNRRVASYKLLTGLLAPPTSYAATVPHISDALKAALKKIPCTIAPTREELLPIMARAHFGLGEKNKWGYLGSRKAVFDEWKSGKSVDVLAIQFDKHPSQIRDYLVEYLLYLEALSLAWTSAEKEKLLKPELEFNPPVRFLQSKGHKDAVGIVMDRTNLKIEFADGEAKKKFAHLIRKLVIDSPSLSATSSYDDVFKSFSPSQSTGTGSSGGSSSTSSSSSQSGGTGGGTSGGPASGPTPAGGPNLTPNRLFNYNSKHTILLHDQLLDEARRLNCKTFPTAGTVLLRCIVEAVLKHIIDTNNANPTGKTMTLGPAVDTCLGPNVTLSKGDARILSEFKNQHMNYLNLGAHGNQVADFSRLMSVRNCVDQFIRAHI